MLVSSSMGVLPLWILTFCAFAVCKSVRIANGTVVGISDDGNGVEKFLGLPFAQPPIGDRRLRQAGPLQESFGTLQADKFGPSCISARNQSDESEDCLTLNIWRPATVARSNVSLPVLVWLYGGSLTSGNTVSPSNHMKACNTSSSMVAHMYQ
jgi:carboxylesterase type B